MNTLIWELIDKIMLARALYTAASLEIADLLKEKSLSLEELAKLTKTNPDTLERLLRYLIASGIFMQQSDNRYDNNEQSLYMQKDHPATVYPFLLHDDESRWNAFGHLTYSISTGKPSFDHLYGKNYFASLSSNPILSKRFDDAMTIISEHEETIIAKSLTFTGSVADIGGGKGTLLCKIAKNHPTTETILFDLPQVVNALEHNPLITSKRTGSFFEPISISAQTFVLKRVLHDWDDEQTLIILRNIATTMRPTDRLLIIDAIVDQCENKRMIMAIDLALLTIFGGKERTKAEFGLLLEQADLTIVKITQLTPTLHCIECKRITEIV